MNSGKIISRKTTVQELLDSNEHDVIEALTRLNRNFSKLKNPLLKRLFAKRVSIEDACRIANCNINDFFRSMKEIGFKLAETPGNFAANADHVFKIPAPGKTVELDVRPILDADKDPLKQIMLKVKDLKQGEYLKIINSFQPLPLINLLSGKGFQSHTELIDSKEVHTWFFKTDEEPGVEAPSSNPLNIEYKLDQLLTEFDGKIKTIDVTMLEMPAPMISILEELDNLPAKEALFVKHKKVPVYLLPHLHDKGFEYVIRQEEANRISILIYKP